MKTIAWKLSLWKPNSFIVLCMYALKLNSKFLIERNIFPAFLTIQIDQLSPADSVLHRPWKAPKKGFKTSLISVSSVTGVGVKFLPWKKKIKLYMTINFWSFSPLQISMYKLNENIFVLLYWYLSRWKLQLFITFVFSSVVSSLISA